MGPQGEGRGRGVILEFRVRCLWFCGNDCYRAGVRCWVSNCGGPNDKDIHLFQEGVSGPFFTEK